MSDRSENILEFVLRLLIANGGKHPKFRISRALYEEYRLGFGQDVNDVISEMIQLCLVTIDTNEIVEIIPDNKRLIYEKRILHEAIRKSPTLSISIPSAIRRLVQAESPIKLRNVLFYTELRKKLGVLEYAEGDIIYLKPQPADTEPEDERTS